MQRLQTMFLINNFISLCGNTAFTKLTFSKSGERPFPESPYLWKMSDLRINNSISDLQSKPGQTVYLHTIKNLYALYADKLYGLLLKKSCDQQKAEEILIQTFAKAYQVLTNSTNLIIPFSWFIHNVRQLCNPDKNHISTNAVTMEDQILEMIICSGASLSHVAETLKKTESEIKQILKSTLKTYRQ